MGKGNRPLAVPRESWFEMNHPMVGGISQGTADASIRGQRSRSDRVYNVDWFGRRIIPCYCNRRKLPLLMLPSNRCRRFTLHV